MSEAAEGLIYFGEADISVKGIFTDSRNPLNGGAFLAVKGEYFDGHDFIESAARAGCKVFIVSRIEGIRFPEKSSVLWVRDTVEAYGRIAAAYRKSFKKVKVIAVCGSNGKTTTKELIAAVLSKKGKTLASQRSYNNHIGVPQTLLELDSSHSYAVIEAGTNHPGELAPLLKMIDPDYGVLTSIGNEHLEFFGDLDGVLEEEGSIAEALPAGGALFIAEDCYGSREVIGRLKKGVRSIAVSRQSPESAELYGELVSISYNGTTFKVFPKAKEVGKGQEDTRLRQGKIRSLGAHHIINALLAICVGNEMGVPEDEIYQALSECPAPEMRTEIKIARGVTLLVDCYNANQDSVCAALETLMHLRNSGTGKAVALLGTMGELGQSAPLSHRQVALKAATVGVDRALFCGEYAGEMCEVFLANASAGQFSKAFESPEALLEQADEYINAGDSVLLKASRSQRFERLVQRWSLEV
ncbi:MAG: UDP-N-acetylmuramoyl-tripeptide--D-alanyl-D-alanine ligase [Limisphaerales bacterium]|jgi:UDP-N-acetylmuramoyl-tripeptide--D-alanyl-D-alanine ligase|nr:UDP-N-acetylmuramoyl-tripeptide--D-alanyl-D-alanine ligase [Verrucomicrobiota bacterium]